MAGPFGFIPKLAAADSFMGSPSIPLRDRLLGLSMVLKGHPEAAMQLPQLEMQRKLYGELLGGDSAPAPQTAPTADSGPPQMSDLGSVAIPQLGVAPQMAPIPKVNEPPAAPARGGIPADPDALRAWLTPQRARLLAFINPQALQGLSRYVQANQPHVVYGPDGVAYNDRDGSTIGRVAPKVGEGQVPIRDADGNLLGITNVPGYAAAVGESAGATANAQEDAKAARDLVTVPLSDGRSIMLPRSKALSLLGGGAPTDIPAGVPAPNVSSPSLRRPPQADGAELGVAQSPAEQALSKKRATTEGEREAEQPKDYAGLVDQARVSDMTADTMHEILGDHRDPKTGAWVEGGGKSMLGPFTTGFGANLAPIAGTPAHNLETKLDQVRAVTAFDELAKMRAQSPTGGALGQVSDRENRMLASVRGSLDQGQSPDQLAATLRNQVRQLDKIRAQRQQLYNATHGVPPSGPAQPPSRAAIEAEMRRRGLLH
jgi:hypothetical protein